MKINHTIAVAIILAGLSSTASASFFYSQNFDSMGTTGTTPPTGWSSWFLSGDASSLVNPTSGEMASAGSGEATLAVWNQTDGNASFYRQAANMGSTATSPNRLLGTSPTEDRGMALQLSLQNTTGSAINAVNLAYDMECMASGTLKDGFPANSTDELPGYSFYYLDGSTWVHLASLDLSNDTVNSVGHASSDIVYSTPVPIGGTLQFRWYDDNANAFSPDTMYAIDNVNVDVPEPATLSLLALGALAIIARRFKA